MFTLCQLHSFAPPILFLEAPKLNGLLLQIGVVHRSRLKLLAVDDIDKKAKDMVISYERRST